MGRRLGLVRLGTRGADAGFELIEEFGVVVVDGVNQAGDQDFGPHVGLGEEAMDEMGSTAAFEIAGRKREGVEKSAVLLATLKEALAKETIEGRHDGGVRESGIEALGDLLHGGAAKQAEHGEHLALAAAKGAERRWRCFVDRAETGWLVRSFHRGFKSDFDDSSKMGMERKIPGRMD